MSPNPSGHVPSPVDHRDPELRLRALFDRGTLRLLADPDGSGVLSGRGRVDGIPAIAFATDATRKGGALGVAGCRRIVEAIGTAVRERVPVAGLWHSGGARLAEGVVALDGVGRVFAAVVQASGRIPQISAVLGPAAGGAAYAPALTDIVIRSRAGRLFVTGDATPVPPPPGTALPGHTGLTTAFGGPFPGAPAHSHSRPATGARSTGVPTGVPTGPSTSASTSLPTGPSTGASTSLPTGPSAGFSAGPEAGAHGSEVVHLTAADDEAALAQTRALIVLLGRQGRVSPDDVKPGASTGISLDALIPAGSIHPYDVRPVIRGLLDEHGTELHAGWAPNVVTTLGRFAGRTIGVIANNPLHLGGCLDAPAAEKAARFVRMCDSLGLPLIVLVDAPGHLPGPGDDWDGVIRRGAKLLHAFAEAVVPRVTLVTRRAYGGAYIAMNSRALGATAVFAWPDADVAALDPSAAVGILHRRALAATPPGDRPAHHARLLRDRLAAAGDITQAVATGVIDAVITPTETRRRIAETFAAAPAGRGRPGPTPL
ncbi:carboxyl transferase domain-containing protein [Actinoplanes utahensis]|uniref:carboxyl transferase domain-containing protein n=1 Tax=Actinoplanes utahensis TaxID=1869 RepID=UPI0005B94EBC|nr:carboxyl transferase domain-containing protein [Actinoplanes utahensis]GIF31182.1 propionyl-CoA carboxylase subunit beta [Actinoplanes utahensis]